MNKEKIQENLDIIQHSLHKLDERSQAKILEEITGAIAAFVRSENNDSDATGGIFDTLSEIAESLQEDFAELIGISNNKKTFVRALAKIFTFFLNTNVDTVDNIRKIVKIAIETMLEIWQEPKQ